VPLPLEEATNVTHPLIRDIRAFAAKKKREFCPTPRALFLFRFVKFVDEKLCIGAVVGISFG
jgi:hypothetical protein